jgi:uncharacterized membrane protein YkgB
MRLRQQGFIAAIHRRSVLSLRRVETTLKPCNKPAHQKRQEDTEMESIAIGAVTPSNERAAESAISIEAVGHGIIRYGLAAVILWIGAMKFTAYEATGIQPLVSHSPLMSWMYGFLSVRGVSNLLGVVEILTAVLVAARPVSAWVCAVGSFLAAGIFLTTLTFLFSTPGWEPSLGGFPALSAMPGQFLLKDVVLLGAAVWSLGESLGRVQP